jgi:hypothetical protein
VYCTSWPPHEAYVTSALRDSLHRPALTHTITLTITNTEKTPSVRGGEALGCATRQPGLLNKTSRGSTYRLTDMSMLVLPTTAKMCSPEVNPAHGRRLSDHMQNQAQKHPLKNTCAGNSIQMMKATMTRKPESHMHHNRPHFRMDQNPATQEQTPIETGKPITCLASTHRLLWHLHP